MVYPRLACYWHCSEEQHGATSRARDEFVVKHGINCPPGLWEPLHYMRHLPSLYTHISTYVKLQANVLNYLIFMIFKLEDKTFFTCTLTFACEAQPRLSRLFQLFMAFDSRITYANLPPVILVPKDSAPNFTNNTLAAY